MKFNFIPLSQLTVTEKPKGSTCSLNLTSSVLAFSKSNLDIESYKNKYVRLFVDARKNAIGWKFLEHEVLENMPDYAFIKDAPMSKGITQVRLYIPAKMMKLLDIRKGVKYQNMEIQEYRDSLIDGVQVFKYVVLKNPIDETLREVVDEKTVL